MRKQKTDRLDAALLLQLLLEDRFPRVSVPSAENGDLRQLLWHRHRLVQMRTRIMNQLQAVAMNEGVRRKQGLWSKSGRAQSPLAPRSNTDGLKSFSGLLEAGFKHVVRNQPLRSELRKGPKSAVPLADRAIGNLQQWLIGINEPTTRILPHLAQSDRSDCGGDPFRSEG